jgi:hypothetical protein
MKTYEGLNVWVNVFLALAQVKVEWLASWPGRFTPGKGAPGTHWIGG